MLAISAASASSTSSKLPSCSAALMGTTARTRDAAWSPALSGSSDSAARPAGLVAHPQAAAAMRRRMRRRRGRERAPATGRAGLDRIVKDEVFEKHEVALEGEAGAGVGEVSAGGAPALADGAAGKALIEAGEGVFGCGKR